MASLNLFIEANVMSLPPTSEPTTLDFVELPDMPAVYLAVSPVDFRLGINGLCALVQYCLKRNPAEAALFVFTNKRRNAIKLLYWYRNGFCLWMKRLEQDRFFWPRQDDVTITLNVQQLSWLLEGVDISKICHHQSRGYAIFYALGDTLPLVCIRPCRLLLNFTTAKLNSAISYPARIRASTDIFCGPQCHVVTSRSIRASAAAQTNFAFSF